MEWEDCFDEYGYSDDPDGILGEAKPLSGGGFLDTREQDEWISNFLCGENDA